MRKLLNTLYITRPNAYLSKDGMNLVVSENQTEIFRIPIINIENVVTFGYQGASPGCMRLCVDNNVGLTFLSPSGYFVGRLQGKCRGNVLLRKAQYALNDNTMDSLNVSRIMVAAKISNCRAVLMRHQRDYNADQQLSEAIPQMQIQKHLALNASNFDDLRGIEGYAAKVYFSVFDKLIINQKTAFVFNGRNRRPPKDEVNALLSFVYMLIANEFVSALETVGLDPYVGFMHSLRPGRPALALDMMEELRPYLGDRFVLSLINRKQITKKDFKSISDEDIILTDDGRKKIITAWQEKKKDEITHPFLQEKLQIGLLPYAQAMLMARFVRKDIDDYPPFLVK